MSCSNGINKNEMGGRAKWVVLDKFQCVGLSKQITRSQRQNQKIITHLWKRFNSAVHQIKNRHSCGDQFVKYGVTFRENNTLYYLAAIPYTSEMTIPGSMIIKKICQGRFLLFTHMGPMYQIKDSFYLIYKEILPKMNLTSKMNQMDGVIHFERYDNRFNWNHSRSVVKIYVLCE